MTSDLLVRPTGDGGATGTAAPTPLRRTTRRLLDLVPRVELDPAAFDARHHVLRVVLALHLLLVVVVAAANSAALQSFLDGAAGGTGLQLGTHEQMTWAFVLVAAVCTVLGGTPRSRRAQAVVVSLGLLSCANALVHGSGGQTDMHLDYLVVLALIGLYQDWVPFALAIGVVALHHALVGLLAPSMVFSSGLAQQQPLEFAAVHAGFVLAMCAAQVVYWHFTEQSEALLRQAIVDMSTFSLAARHTDNGVLVTGTDGIVQWINPRYTAITGYTPQQAVGRPASELLHGPEVEVASQLKEFEEGGGEFDTEFRTQMRDGRWVWLDLQVRPIVEDGVVTGHVSVVRDRTDRHAVEEEARTASARNAELATALQKETSVLSGVLSSIPHLVYWKDAQRRYAGANAAFLAWHAITPAGLPGLADVERSDGAGLSGILAALEAEVAVVGRAVVDQHVTAADAQGRTRALLVSVLPQLDAQGRVTGYIGVGADVSDIADLEQQLAQAHRLEAVGQLASGIAHEINTPIQFVSDNALFVADSFAGLMPALRLLQECAVPGADPPDGERLRAALQGVDLDFVTAEVPTALEESLDGLARVAEIVRAMKDFSHPGQESAAADLNRAVETTVQVSRNEWKYVAELVLDLGEDVGLVDCHQGEVKQAVLNMVVNAAHAIEDRRRATGAGALGTIRVSTRRTPRAVLIVIADDGAGMDAAVRQRIFDPFFTTKQVGKGTGQGLSLAHRTIVTRHGGAISVESTPGRGTTFTISLPVTAVPPVPPVGPRP